MKNVVIITSTSPRHVAFVDTLVSKVKIRVSLVLSIDKKTHDENFIRSENKFFKEKRFPKGLQIITSKGSNPFSTRTKELLNNLEPEIGFVFGGPLLPKNIIDIPKRGFVNLHTGLVQHHRGVDSPYWAIHEERPETIGATLHYINTSIDTGDIIMQSQTKDLTADDTPEDIFMKTCITGFDLLQEKGYHIMMGMVDPKPILNKGKLYQIKDMSPKIMKEIREKTPKIIGNYINGNYSRSL